jgi:uncharacterized coiled-coil protein SlyX
VSRRTRTLEILTAANLLPQQLAVEQARGARDARVAQALASLVPSAISAGTGALGTLADYNLEKADREALNLDRLARGEVAKTNAASAASNASAAATNAEAARVKAEADRVKAAAEAAERDRKSSEALAESRRKSAVSAIEGGAGSAAALLPVTPGKREVVGTFRPGESPLDEIERIQADSGMGLDQLAGLVDKQGLATRKAAADLKLAERKATMLPAGPTQKSSEEAAREKTTKNVKAAAELRKEFNSLPAVKKANDSEYNFRIMESTVSGPSAAGDISLIFSFMKVLDPGSVVKETEFANVAAAAGVDDRVINSINRAVVGERLTAEQRQDLLRQAQKFRDTANAAADAEIQRYTAIAERSGFAPQDVVTAPKKASTSPSKPIDQMTAEEVDARIRELEGQQ